MLTLRWCKIILVISVEMIYWVQRGGAERGKERAKRERERQPHSQHIFNSLWGRGGSRSLNYWLPSQANIPACQAWFLLRFARTPCDGPHFLLTRTRRCCENCDTWSGVQETGNAAPKAHSRPIHPPHPLPAPSPPHRPPLPKPPTPTPTPKLLWSWPRGAGWPGGPKEDMKGWASSNYAKEQSSGLKRLVWNNVFSLVFKGQRLNKHHSTTLIKSEWSVKSCMDVYLQGYLSSLPHLNAALSPPPICTSLHNKLPCIHVFLSHIFLPYSKPWYLKVACWQSCVYCYQKSFLLFMYDVNDRCMNSFFSKKSQLCHIY